MIIKDPHQPQHPLRQKPVFRRSPLSNVYHDGLHVVANRSLECASSPPTVRVSLAFYEKTPIDAHISV